MTNSTDRLMTLDQATRAELATLIRSHRQAALATLDDAGAPYTAMTAYAPEPEFGALLVHLSDLAAHKAHLRADPRVGLLIFEPDDGRTEVLSRRRLTLRCIAEIVPRDGADHVELKAHYLAALPRHEMMFGLGDFNLVRLVPRSGLLNAGFGRAYRVTPADLAAASNEGL